MDKAEAEENVQVVQPEGAYASGKFIAIRSGSPKAIWVRDFAKGKLLLGIFHLLCVLLAKSITHIMLPGLCVLCSETVCIVRCLRETLQKVH